MNSVGIAMASDRHMYRRDDFRSTGLECKLSRLHGRVPAAFMHSGRMSVLGLPTARLTYRLSRALQCVAPGSGPDSLAESVVRALGAPASPDDIASGYPEPNDAAVFADTLNAIVSASSYAVGAQGLRDIIDQASAASAYIDTDPGQAESLSRQVWAARLSDIPCFLDVPAQAAFSAQPELCAEAVVQVMSRAWQVREPHTSLMVGLCCPDTGVPVLVAVEAWAGLGNKKMLTSRLARRHVAAWRSGATLLTTQGSGKETVHAMLDGIEGENWLALDAADRGGQASVINERWARAHEGLAVASVKELSSVATGLVRAAEIMGFLLGRDEGTVATVDCVQITPEGTYRTTMPPAA
jgi:hypothetical protein